MGVKNEKRTDGADAEVQARTVYRFARSSDGAGMNLLYGKTCKQELVCKLAVVVCESGA